MAEPPQDSSAAVDKLALLRHAQACQAVLSAVLAGQLELALRGAFSVWRAATGVALAADAPSAPEPAAKADTVAEAVAVAAMERHCQACHRVLSAALSRQLELCVRVALHAWRTVAQAGPVEAEPGRPPVAEVAQFWGGGVGEYVDYRSLQEGCRILAGCMGLQPIGYRCRIHSMNE